MTSSCGINKSSSGGAGLLAVASLLRWVLGLHFSAGPPSRAIPAGRIVGPPISRPASAAALEHIGNRKSLLVRLAKAGDYAVQSRFPRRPMFWPSCSADVFVMDATSMRSVVKSSNGAWKLLRGLPWSHVPFA
ncbi:hypothetical protein GY45DRAFT_671214 [Cubamyces sp. BRFM 1775]|nr:hypothetical protein GY45DRAFT_671214 [Cubamyces sp. BRFM 1775]